MVILCDCAEITAENSRALKQETSIWHRAIPGSAGIKGFIGKSNLIQRASTFFVGLKKKQFPPSKLQTQHGFSSKRTLGPCVPPRNNQVLPFTIPQQVPFTRKICDSPSRALQDMLVSTRLTPSQRWTLLESSKRSAVFFEVWKKPPPGPPVEAMMMRTPSSVKI